MGYEVLSDLTAEYVRKILRYEPETGLFFWRPNPEKPKEWNTRRAGKVAGGRSGGSQNPETIQIRIDDRLYLANRLAWLYVTGEWPKGEVDHKNGHPGENQWSNLRDSTHSENMRNKAKQSNNTSGFVGVVYRPKCRQPWEAKISVNKKEVWNRRFDSAQEAAAARRVELERIHGEFALTDEARVTRYNTKRRHCRPPGEAGCL